MYALLQLDLEVGFVWANTFTNQTERQLLTTLKEKILLIQLVIQG